MQIELTPTEVAMVLAKSGNRELLVFLATLAPHDDAELSVSAIADQHNGSSFHRKAAPWLRQLADALEAVETRDAAIDAAGRVA